MATSPSFGPLSGKEGTEEDKTGGTTTPSSPLTPQHDLNATELGLSDVREEEDTDLEEIPTAPPNTTVEDETTTTTTLKRKKSRSVSRETQSKSNLSVGDENVNILSDKEYKEMIARASPPPSKSNLPSSPRRVCFIYDIKCLLE